jgi:predicted MFS family arabinose efflux permease
MPASSAILPQTVPADERQQANALNRLFFNAAAVIGAPVAGVVVASVGPGWGIAVDAATFVLAGACFAFLRVPTAAPAAAGPATGLTVAADEVLLSNADVDGFPADAATTSRPEPPAAEERKGIFADLLTGWGEFRSRTWLWVIVAGFCVLNAAWAGGLYVLGPSVANDSIGRRAWGFVLAAQTIGMIVGALVALRIRMSRMLFFGTACTAALGLPLVVLGIAPRFAFLVGAAFIAGLGLEQFGVAWETTMQEHIPADKLARVYSYDMVGSFIAIPVGEILIGPIANLVGTEAALVGAGALVGVSVLLMLSSRDVRHLRHRVPEGESAPMEELPA